MQYPGKATGCGNGKATGCATGKVLACCPCADVGSLTVTIENVVTCPDCIAWFISHGARASGNVNGTYDLPLTKPACISYVGQEKNTGGTFHYYAAAGCSGSPSDSTIIVNVHSIAGPGIGISFNLLDTNVVFPILNWCIGQTIVVNDAVGGSCDGTKLFAGGRATVTFNA